MSEWVGFNVPVNTLIGVISETSWEQEVKQQKWHVTRAFHTRGSAAGKSRRLALSSRRHTCPYRGKATATGWVVHGLPVSRSAQMLPSTGGFTIRAIWANHPQYVNHSHFLACRKNQSTRKFYRNPSATFRVMLLTDKNKVCGSEPECGRIPRTWLYLIIGLRLGWTDNYNIISQYNFG